jgi:SAM-dependent methyltransferase
MDYDAELRLLNEVLRRAYGIERHDHVLDIGCGAGQTTREAARLAAEGGALGVDLSAEAIARARDLAQAEGIRNVTFEMPTRRSTPSPGGVSTSPSAGSGRCSSLTPLPRSPTSDGRCGPPADW